MVKLETTTAYTVQEVAERIHRTPVTVRNYIREGRLRAQKVGNTWYITEETLTELITGENPKKR